MPVARIAENINTTQTGNFHFTIVFVISESQTLTEFSLSNVVVTDADGNLTIANLMIVGEVEDGNARIGVTLPDEIIGAFTVGVTGNVMVDGVSEMLSGATKTINYDTLSSLGATFGTPEYRDGGIIAIPVTFAYNVIAPSATIFKIARVSGDALDGMETWILGEDKDYELLCQMPLDRKGKFSIGANGTVFKEFSGNWDTVTATAIEVDWNTSEPRYLKYDIPANYTAEETFDVLVQLHVPSTFADPTVDIHKDATFLDFFIFEGADLGVPNIYRKTDNTYPELPIPDFPSVDGNADWVQTDLTTQEATIYLLRWDPVVGNPIGTFNMRIKPGTFRGPVR